jgi:hypothetical protein
MRKLLLTATAAATLSVPVLTTAAHAQLGGWTSNNYGGPTTYYNGTGAYQGWSGNSNSYGGPTTYTNFNGPNGQHYSCTSNNFGGPTTYTNCQ